MNIKDLDLSKNIIKTHAEYEEFKDNIKNVFPHIEQNYSDDNYLLANFILKIESVYKSNPELNKILLVQKQDTYNIDGYNYTHSAYFSVEDAETQKKLTDKSSLNLNDFVVGYYDNRSHEKSTDFEYGGYLWDKICEDLFIEDFNNSSREDRFKLYKEIAKFAYFNNEEPLLKMIKSLEDGISLETEYKTVKFFGHDIEMKTIDIDNNHFYLGASEQNIKKIKNSLDDIESSYIIGLIKEQVNRNNLNTNENINITFEPVEPRNLKDYKITMKDCNNNTAEMNISLALNRYLTKETYFKYDYMDDILISTISRNENTNDLRKNFSRDEKEREDNYTDVSKFISSSKQRYKM